MPGWTWDPIADDFAAGVEHARTYAAANGGARIPNSHKTEGGFNLGCWVSERRKAYKKGKLDAASVAALKAVPGWTWDARKRKASTVPPTVSKRPRIA